MISQLLLPAVSYKETVRGATRLLKDSAASTQMPQALVIMKGDTA
jgi:hypothetical protein